jgi:membrane-associated phospholipid phosphatase
MKANAELLAQWALWAGQHALPLFFVMLALILAATCACWWTLRRYTVPRRQSTNLPTLPMGLRIAVGFALILVGAGVFAELAGQLDAGEELGRADQALADALRTSVPPPALQVFAALTGLGDTATLTGLCIGIAIALIALDRRWLALGWVVAVAGNGVLNHTLKQIFARVRPLDPDGFVLEQGFSFPSGHSSGSVVAYGMLAYVALRLLPARWHLPTVVAAVALAFTVGASRLFLRVHFASDVIAGFASGAAWLAICVTSIELTRWYRQRTA